MILKYIFILAFFVANDTGAFLFKNRFSSSCRLGRQQESLKPLKMNIQINYEPFDSDIKIQAMITTESSNIKDMNSSAIKTELSSMGFQTKGIVDKSELVRYLAKKRVACTLQISQGIEIERKNKENLADSIEDEMKKIEKSKMTDLSMINELHLLRYKVYLKSDLIHQLALARLGICNGNNTSDDKNTVEIIRESKIYNDTMTDFQGVYDRLIQKMLRNSTTFSNFNVRQIKSKMNYSAVQEFTRNIGLTKTEQEAEKFISQSKVNYDNDNIDSSGSSSSSNNNHNTNNGFYVNDKNISKLSTSQIIELLTLANKLKSFDEIVYFAGNISRSDLVQILQYRDESIPKYAIRSALAAILADSLLVDRTNEEINRDKFNSFNDDFIPASYDTLSSATSKTDNRKGETSKRIDQINTIVSDRRKQYTKDTSDNKSKDAVERNIKRKKYVENREISSFFFEKELIQKAMKTMKNIVKSITNQETFIELNSEGSRTSFKNFLSSMITLGCNACFTLALWAGGNTIPPYHVIFISAMYCLLSRKGIWSFLGSFLLVRLFREALLFRR